MPLKLQQPESGELTIRYLRESSHPESFTIGRIECAVVHQGCNPYTLLRILFDYYSDMAYNRRTGSASKYWEEKLEKLVETEAAWMNGK